MVERAFGSFTYVFTSIMARNDLQPQKGFVLRPLCLHVFGVCVFCQLSFAPNREKTYRLNLPIKVKPLAGPAPDFRDAGQIGE